LSFKKNRRTSKSVKTLLSCLWNNLGMWWKWPNFSKN